MAVGNTSFSAAIANAFSAGRGELKMMTAQSNVSSANCVAIMTLGDSQLGMDHTGFYIITANQGGFQILANGVSYSPAANGYTITQNGFIEVWGQVLANTSVGNATFPLAFPAACLNVMATANVATTYGSCLAANTTVAQIRTGAVGAATMVQYRAIGY